MLKNWRRRKNNHINGEKNPSDGKFYAILHKFCHRLKKIHKFRINLSIVSKKFMNLMNFAIDGKKHAIWEKREMGVKWVKWGSGILCTSPMGKFQIPNPN